MTLQCKPGHVAATTAIRAPTDRGFAVGARRIFAGGSVLTLTLALAACGSNFELESQPTEITVANGTWRFEGSGDAAVDVDRGRRPGTGNADAADGGLGGGGEVADVGVGQPTDAGVGADAGGVTDVCVACGEGCVDKPCATASCVDTCCAWTPVADGAPCEDGDLCVDPSACEGGACVGPAKDCDDALACTVDACDAATGQCNHTVADGACLIDGVCYADGDGDGASACAVCAPSSAADGWSTKPGCCTQDADCPSAKVCDAPVCDLATGTCGTTPKLGCCTSDAACNDGDLCTIDSCDLGTGVCSIMPKTCPDGSSCEPGACDATTGLCTTAVKPGACAIGGSCFLDGDLSPLEPCLRCQPGASATQWTPALGASCDDGEICTLNDACTEKGSCLGQPKAACCKSNADCQYAATACTSATCQLPGNVCVTDAKPGCCESGACCDLANHSEKPKGTMCAATIVASEYQCVGQQIQRRDLYPGCTGQSATLCSSDPAYTFAGSWTTTQTCPSTTTCTKAGSGQPPTCAPKGTCAGACGGWASGNACQCTPGCVQAGTCCADYKAQCACSGGACCDTQQGVFAAVGSNCGATQTQYQCNGQKVQKRTGAGTCSGSSASCGAVSWGLWSDEQTCPSGTQCVVNGSQTSASCQATGGSCVGKCGGQSGSCWCDSGCKGLGDCCKDFSSVCASSVCGAPAGSCKGACDGQAAAGCWCDAACTQLGDCCADKSPCCG